MLIEVMNAELDVASGMVMYRGQGDVGEVPMARDNEQQSMHASLGFLAFVVEERGFQGSRASVRALNGLCRVKCVNLTLSHGHAETLGMYAADLAACLSHACSTQPNAQNPS